MEYTGREEDYFFFKLFFTLFVFLFFLIIFLIILSTVLGFLEFALIVSLGFMFTA